MTMINLRIQAIEGDMDVMIKYFDELNDLGAQLVQQVDGSEDSAKAVSSQLQNCQDRWDNLVQRMQHCSKQVLMLLHCHLKKSGSTFVIITLENLNRFSYSLYRCKQEEIFYTYMKMSASTK